MSRAGSVVLMAALAAAVAAPAQAAPADYRVASRATVSGPVDLPAECGAHQAESQPQLVAHPDDPARLSAVYLQDGVTAAVGAGSRDGGRRWERAPVPGATACTGGPGQRAGTVNPLLAAGPGGRAWFGNSWVGNAGTHQYGVLAHPTDAAGSEWSAGVDPYGDYAQNLALAGDPSSVDSLLAVWTHFDQVPNPFTYVPAGTYALAATSSDGGATFSEPVVAGDAGVDRFVINVRVARASDGALLLVFDSAAAEDLPGGVVGAETRFLAHAARSEDGGRTWSAPVEAGAPIFKTIPDPERRDPDSAPTGAIAGSAKFDLAAGRGGRAVVAWADQREDGGWVIRMTRSGDGGRDWSRPFDALALDAPAFMPAVAIDSRGTIGLFWYDWTRDRNGDEPLTTTPWFAASSDGGRTWRKTALDVSFDLRGAYEDELPYDGTAIGVYQDLVALTDGFGVLYTVGPPLARDGRTDVRFARLEARGGRLVAAVRPKTARAGRRTRFRFVVRDAAGGAVAGATIRFAGRKRRTNARGRASIRVRPRRPGVLRARISRDGFEPATLRVRVRRRSG